MFLLDLALQDGHRGAAGGNVAVPGNRQRSFDGSSLRSGSCLTFRAVCSHGRQAGMPGGPYGGTVSGSDGGNVVPAEVAGELRSLRAENARLLRLLKLTRQEAAAPGPCAGRVLRGAAGAGACRVAAEAKVALFGALFAARTDVYAIRWENARTGQKAGWLPAVRGGWRKGVPHADRDYLPLTPQVLASHLSGEVHIGLYPLLDGDRCWWLAADFDGPAAMLDALDVPQSGPGRCGCRPALEVSRSGVGAHAWVFFTGPGPGGDGAPPGHWAAARGDGAARADGPGQLRPAVPVPGRAAAGGVGNLIAAPLYGRSRRDGATVFLDPGHPGAAPGPVGLPVHARPDDPPGSGEPRTKPGGSRSRAERVNRIERRRSRPGPGQLPAGHPRPARGRHPARAGRADTSIAWRR